MELRDVVEQLVTTVDVVCLDRDRGGQTIVFDREQLLEYTQLAMRIAVQEVVKLEGANLDDV